MLPIPTDEHSSDETFTQQFELQGPQNRQRQYQNNEIDNNARNRVSQPPGHKINTMTGISSRRPELGYRRTLKDGRGYGEHQPCDHQRCRDPDGPCKPYVAVRGENPSVEKQSGEFREGDGEIVEGVHGVEDR